MVIGGSVGLKKYCQEKTHEELINKNDAIISAGNGYKEEIIAV
jgi:hypothetical protein